MLVMTQNHQFQPPPPPPPQSLSTVTIGCAICNSDDHLILHNHIEPRTTTSPKKLCTSCLLKLHPMSFCPTCFNLHDQSSLNPPSLSSSSFSSNRYLTCLKCNSFSHVTCVPPDSPKSPYLCPPCFNPSYKFFDFKKPKQFKVSDVSGVSDGGEKVVKEQKQKQVVMNERGARVLLLAAKMSAITMNRALSIARGEAERKVKEAALARKRAKEAIDHVMVLATKFGNVKPRRDVGVVHNVNHLPAVSNLSQGAKNLLPVKLEKNGGLHNVGDNGNMSHGNGNGNRTVAVVVVAPSGNVVEDNNNHGGDQSTAG